MDEMHLARDDKNSCLRDRHDVDVSDVYQTIDMYRVTCNNCTARIRQVVGSSTEAVNHPAHYGEEDNPYEAIKVIEAWELGFCLGNTVKYISRAGKKSTDTKIQDLEKALWYLQREVARLKS